MAVELSAGAMARAVRLCVCGAAVAGGALWLGLEGSAAADSTAHCAPAGAHVLAADALVEVYTAGSDVEGCAAATKRSYKLGTVTPQCLGKGGLSGGGTVSIVAVAGPFAGYGLRHCGVDTLTAQVGATDLATGRRVFLAPATTTPGLAEAEESISAIVVESDGAVAWIARSGQVFKPNTRSEVVAHDSRGLHALDTNRSIDVTSLRLHGSQLTWGDGSRHRKATLA